MAKFVTTVFLASLAVMWTSPGAHAEDIRVVGKLMHDDDFNGSVESVAFSPDGRSLAAAYNAVVGADPSISKRNGQGGVSKGRVVVWDVAKKQRTATFECGGHLQFVAFGTEGKSLAVAQTSEAGGQVIRVLDVADGKDRFSMTTEGEKGLQRSVSALAFSPDGDRLIVGTAGYPKGGELVVIDSGTGKERTRLKGGETSVSSISFSADGKLMASVGEDVVQIWDMTTEKERNSFPVGRGRLAAISPRGDVIAVSTTGSRKYPGTVALTLRDAKTGKEESDFKRPTSGVAVAFTPDGKRIVYGCGNGIILLYDAATGKRIAGTDGPSFVSLTMTRKGDMLATGNQSGTVWLWDIGGNQ